MSARQHKQGLRQTPRGAALRGAALCGAALRGAALRGAALTSTDGGVFFVQFRQSTSNAEEDDDGVPSNGVQFRLFLEVV